MTELNLQQLTALGQLLRAIEVMQNIDDRLWRQHDSKAWFGPFPMWRIHDVGDRSVMVHWPLLYYALKEVNLVFDRTALLEQTESICESCTVRPGVRYLSVGPMGKAKDLLVCDECWIEWHASTADALVDMEKDTITEEDTKQ